MIRRLLVVVLLSIIVIGGSASFRPTESASTEPCTQDHQVWLFTLFGKGEADDLTPDQKRQLRAAIDAELQARRMIRSKRGRR